MRTVLLGVLLGVLLALGSVAMVRADTALTSAVAAAWFPRNLDAGLHDIAHQRVAESRACRCLDHGGMRSGTAEVLAWTEGGAGPIANWASSSLHNSILSNTAYGRIGCASLADGARVWFACVLAFGPLPTGNLAVARAPAPAPVAVLPDTAMPLARIGHPVGVWPV